jgi:predicted nucleic acid-binding protein
VIVVDSNVVAYCWLNGPLTAMAQRVFARDPQWHVPVLWRSELRSVLSGACRARREHLPSPADILRVCESSNLSAYDAEFIALARQLGALLVTEDRAILKAFPDTAVTMANYVERAPGIN